MRGRVGGAHGGAPTDLLVCFPSKAHLGLIPKPICSPSRPGEPGKRNGGKAGGGRGHASPLFKNKSKNLSNEIADEPTSPKVTCAGQIKVRPKPRPRPNSNSKDWLSVVEEIERFHKEKKKPHWLEGLGIKKDIMQFMGALRGLRFDMRCFGSFHGAVDCSSEDEEEDEDEDEEEEDGDDDDQDEDKSNSSNSRTIFSKWFMVLEESQSNACKKEEEEEEVEEKDVATTSSSSSSVPPPNALLLMRCRSAPAKGWIEGDEGEKRLEEEISARTLREEEKEKERLILMSYAPDFFKVSTDIAKETWVVSGMDPLARSRSWRK
ncbi:Armadillo-like helical-containing protein [Dioscorea alata]|uniref:Armadillo-like helical-containing protein n=1 Tax=Dioscorea alata TaxID=55571 RepID=A0ACB7TXG8_DIOAL|nr:Armadillo-like helical-containing protein [Dioscorea alata]